MVTAFIRVEARDKQERNDKADKWELWAATWDSEEKARTKQKRRAAEEDGECERTRQEEKEDYGKQIETPAKDLIWKS